MSRSSIIALGVFVALAVLVLTMRTAVAQRLQQRVLELVRPIQTATQSTASQFQAFGNGLKTLDQLEHEVGQLRVENEQLRTANELMNEKIAENNRLRDALGFKQRSNFSLIPARIIARSTSTWWSTVQIDRGEADGLDSDMPVVTDQGLVGKTTTVAANTAVVLLITDENCKVSAYVEGSGDLPVESRDKGLVSGERFMDFGSPETVLNFLPKTAQIAPGQKVFSYGASGGVFPRGLLLGVVRTVTPHELDIRATITPAVDLARLENVFIVRGTRDLDDNKPAPPVAPAVPRAAAVSNNGSPMPAPTVRAALPVSSPTPATRR